MPGNYSSWLNFPERTYVAGKTWKNYTLMYSYSCTSAKKGQYYMFDLPRKKGIADTLQFCEFVTLLGWWVHMTLSKVCDLQIEDKKVIWIINLLYIYIYTWTLQGVPNGR